MKSPDPMEAPPSTGFEKMTIYHSAGWSLSIVLTVKVTRKAPDDELMWILQTFHNRKNNPLQG